MDRYRILIRHPKFPAPMKQSLRNRGIEIVEDEVHPSAETLRQTLACVADFGDDVRHPIRALAWKRRMSAHGVPVLTWNRDAPHNNNLPRWRLALFSNLGTLDVYATHSLIDERWLFAKTILFLPNAVDTSIYNLRGEMNAVFAHLRDQSAYEWDVSFYGALDGERYQEAALRQAFFTELAGRLTALNIRHRFIDNTHTDLSESEQVEMMQRSRININFGARCDYGGFPASGLPERYFGIPACGGFLLSDERLHNADCFNVGQHIDTYADLNDCVKKICFYLENPASRRALAESAWQHVMEHHTYASRAKELHTTLIDWHAGKRGLIKYEYVDNAVSDYVGC